MFAKIFWLVFPPCNLIVLLAIIAWLARRKFPGLSLSAGIIAFAFFIVAGILPTGMAALHLLEQDYPPRVIMPGRIDGVLVLGGAFDSRIAMARGQTEFSASGERITEATRLMRLYPRAVIVYSDGNGSLDRDLYPETVLFKSYLRGQRLDDRNVRYENRARNTYDNIFYGKLIARPKPGQTWLLVTSAWHMRRAMALIRKQGWPGAIMSDPVDYQTTGDGSDYAPHFDVLGNLAAFNLAAREYLALLSYRLDGRIDSML